MPNELDIIIKRGAIFDPILNKKSPTMTMMIMQNYGLKGYYTGCEPAGDHHDEMGGVKPVREKLFLFGKLHPLYVLLIA